MIEKARMSFTKLVKSAPKCVSRGTALKSRIAGSPRYVDYEILAKTKERKKKKKEDPSGLRHNKEYLSVLGDTAFPDVKNMFLFPGLSVVSLNCSPFSPSPHSTCPRLISSLTNEALPSPACGSPCPLPWFHPHSTPLPLCSFLFPYFSILLPLLVFPRPSSRPPPCWRSLT